MKKNFDAHNEEVRWVWETYRTGTPVRVPMILGIQPRYTMFDHPANPRGITFEQYWSDPQMMLERLLEHLEWCAFNLPQDAPMGLPEKWTVWADFQNVYEAAALACPIEYCGKQVPDTRRILCDENKRSVIDQGIPDPFENPFLAKVWSFHEHFEERQRAGYEWKGRPIAVGAPSGAGTDGPLTGACNIRGAMEFCVDLIDDPQYADDLLAFLTETIIVRISAFRQRLGQPVPDNAYGFADDSVALLSTEMVAERIVPHHRRLVEAFATQGPNSIHLCGDATRHFPMLKRELNIGSFDTGFPVDFGELRRQVGEEVEIMGGPSVPFLSHAAPEETKAETRRVLESGIMAGGRFILREGNNLAPEITVENVRAMYETVRTHGVYGSAA